MGRETVLQAFPEDWTLLARVRSGSSSGDDIGTVMCYLSWLRRKQITTAASAFFDHEDDPERLSIFRETIALLESDRELLWATGNIDRRFDVLRYLMLESSTSVEQQQLCRYAVAGREAIHLTATASQGYPIMWNDVDTTRAIHDAIASLTFGNIAVHYGTAKFNDLPLYKGTYDKRELSNLYSYFCQLKEYYRFAANVGYATIVYLD